MKIIIKALFLLLMTISFSNAELLKPNNSISPKEVVSIQLSGLKDNDQGYKDSGIEIEIALRKHNLPYEFSKNVITEADSFSPDIKASDFQGRKELRN